MIAPGWAEILETVLNADMEMAPLDGALPTRSPPGAESVIT